MTKETFFGVFDFIHMECASCQHSIYFAGVELTQELVHPVKTLPKGWDCVDAYLDLKTNTLTFVKSWKAKNQTRPNDLYEDESYTFNMADLIPLFWKQNK